MKCDIIAATEFEFVHDCYRSFSFDILATPQNFLFRKFFESELNMFRVINRDDSDEIELRSHVGDSVYIDKKALKKDFESGKNFVMLLKNSGIKIVIPTPNFEWLFNTGRESIRWNPVKSQSGHTFLEFNDKFDKSFSVVNIAYHTHSEVNDMADVFPF